MTTTTTSKSKPKREAIVSLWRPGSQISRAVFRASTIRKCEQWIAQREKTDPEGVHRGDYCIDGTPRAEWEYQRLREREARRIQGGVK